MTLKHLFLAYAERQKSANEHKLLFGSDNEKTIKEYEEANILKRELLVRLEKLEILTLGFD